MKKNMKVKLHLGGKDGKKGREEFEEEEEEEEEYDCGGDD